MKIGMTETSMFTSFYKGERPNGASLVQQTINWKVKECNNPGAIAVKGNAYMFCLFFSVRN